MLKNNKKKQKKQEEFILMYCNCISKIRIASNRFAKGSMISIVRAQTILFLI